uniref:uncharacterized protein n=1 Tax=Myxine glutinosa TaxID=7769 RepID=UPI00358FBE36
MVVNSCFKDLEGGVGLKRVREFVPEAEEKRNEDPHHPVTQLLIQECDDQLLHCGPERILAEVHRKYGIRRGREAIRRHQHQCHECRRWHANPEVPRMADLPPARLRLYKPAFYSTGVDCFGPFTIKIGRRTEKCWGIIFKCLTTHSVHLGLLEGLDADAFLISVRRLIARRGKLHETFPGSDGRARTASVQVRGKNYVRPLAKLIRLLKLDDDG